MSDAQAGGTANKQEVGITESQLELWAHRESPRAATITLEFVREALAKRIWPHHLSYEAYLQGSYGNETNISADAMVDIVIELTSTFLHDVSLLTPAEQAQFRETHSTAAYGWGEFKAEVIEAMAKYFGRAAVEVRPKTLRVEGEREMLPANVLVAVQHRRYTRYRNIADQSFDEGITFYDPTASRWVVGYPKHHRQNGIDKDVRTDGWFKPAVRACKQMRALLVDLNTIPPDLAQPWFVESLLYNVPDSEFGVRYRHTIVKALRYLKETDLTGFVRQDGLAPLFGNGAGQWSYRDATRFVDELIRLWWNWK